MSENSNYASIQHTEALSPITRGGDEPSHHSTGEAQVNPQGRTYVHPGSSSIQWGAPSGQPQITQHAPAAYRGEATEGSLEIDPTSVKSAQGAPKAISAVLADDDVVRIGGIETRVSVAESQGLLQRDASGRLVDTEEDKGASSRSTPGRVQQQEQADPTRTHTADLSQADPHVPARSGDETQDTALELLQSHLNTTVAAKVRDAFATDEISADVVEGVMQELGCSQDAALDYLQTVHDGLVAVGTNALAQVGVTEALMEDFQAWAEEDQGQRWNAASDNLRNYQNGTKHAELGAEYMMGLSQRAPKFLAEQLQQSGFQNVRWDSNAKDITFDHPQVGNVSWRGAYKAGVIGTPTARK
jgi:hypothetical protein